MNQLQGASIVELLPAPQQHYLRAAGSNGCAWFFVAAVEHRMVEAFVCASAAWYEQEVDMCVNGKSLSQVANSDVVESPLNIRPLSLAPLLVAPCCQIDPKRGGYQLRNDVIGEAPGGTGPTFLPSLYHHHPVLVVNWYRLLSTKARYERVHQLPLVASYILFEDVSRVTDDCEATLPLLVPHAVELSFSRHEEPPSLSCPPVCMVAGRSIHSLDVFANVTSIGHDFLRACPSLCSVDLSFAANVTSVGRSFLRSCCSLRTVDLGPLANVTVVGPEFLSESGLDEVDVGPLRCVVDVGRGFMSGCHGLCEIRGLGSWTKLATVGASFLSSCDAIRELELFPLAAFGSNSETPMLPPHMLSHCRSLCRVRFAATSEPCGAANALTIGNDVLACCERLTSMRFGCEGESFVVREIGSGLLSNCPYLEVADLSNMSGVSCVGDMFLTMNTNLLHVALPHLHPQGATVGSLFLSMCTSLRTVDLSPLSGVTAVSHSFLRLCTSLQPTVCLDAFLNVTEVGVGFLSMCSGLVEIDLSPLKHVRSRLWAQAFGGCTSLRRVYVGDLPVGHAAFSAERFREKPAVELSKASPPSRDHPNQLMGTSVATLLPPRQQAYVRSAGSKGGHWFYAAAVVTLAVSVYAFVSRGWIEQVIGVAWGLSPDEVGGNQYVRNMPIRLDGLSDVTLHVAPTLWKRGDKGARAWILESGTSRRSTNSSPFPAPNYHHPVYVVNANHFPSGACFPKGAPLMQVTHMSSGADFGHIVGCQCVELCFTGETFPAAHDLCAVTRCPYLRSVSLDVFANVTSIGHDFLRACPSLCSVDLSFAANVTSVGRSFLRSCCSLRTVDLGPLANVTVVGPEFLSESGLDEVDVGPLRCVVDVGRGFMSGCHGLCEIRGLGSWTKLATVGASFLSSCDAIRELELFPLAAFGSNSETPMLPPHMLSHCRSLCRVRFAATSEPCGAANALTIGNDVLACCERLTSMRFGCEGESFVVREIGSGFLGDLHQHQMGCTADVEAFIEHRQLSTTADRSPIVE